MNINGYELLKDWEVSNMGHTTIATRGGKKYFLKRYGSYKMPQLSESVGPKQFDKLKAKFDEFVNYRIEINKALGSVAGPGGNIILPVHWFVHDIYYIEATEWIENAVKEEKVMKSSREDIMLILLTAAGSLRSIHRKNIIHSDLKMGNIMVATNSSGNNVAKIFDFDKSYFVDRIRADDLGGDQSFMSPELVQCFVLDMAEEALAFLSTKSDVFSMGLIFHKYLTGGEFPKISGLTGGLKTRAEKGSVIYCGEAALYGATLEVSSKIGDEYLSHLIAAMLQPIPDDRPTSDEVLEILKTKRVLPLKPDSTIVIASESTSAPAPAKPTATDTGAGAATPAPEPKPAPKPTSGYGEPWPEHDISFITDKMAAMGYVSAEKITRSGSKCYTLYTASGSARMFTLQNLIMLGLAKKGATATTVAETPKPTPAPVADVELWPEDSAYSLKMDDIAASGYSKIEKANKNGMNAYALIKGSGEKVIVTFKTLKMLGFVKKR